MLTIGDAFPQFELTACVSLDPEKAFETITHKTYEGKWKVYFAWPKDFTFICPTEIAEFGRLNGEFADRDAQVLGFSVDSEYVHYAWRRNHEDLRDLPFPMMADLNRELSQALGILNYGQSEYVRVSAGAAIKVYFRASVSELGSIALRHGGQPERRRPIPPGADLGPADSYVRGSKPAAYNRMFPH